MQKAFFLFQEELEVLAPNSMQKNKESLLTPYLLGDPAGARLHSLQSAIEVHYLISPPDLPKKGRRPSEFSPPAIYKKMNLSNKFFVRQVLYM